MRTNLHLTRLCISSTSHIVGTQTFDHSLEAMSFKESVQCSSIHKHSSPQYLLLPLNFCSTYYTETKKNEKPKGNCYNLPTERLGTLAQRIKSNSLVWHSVASFITWLFTFSILFSISLPLLSSKTHYSFYFFSLLFIPFSLPGIPFPCYSKFYFSLSLVQDPKIPQSSLGLCQAKGKCPLLGYLMHYNLLPII